MTDDIERTPGLPESPDPDPLLDEWLRTHREATGDQEPEPFSLGAMSDERPQARQATQTVERGPVWDPERGSWVKAVDRPTTKPRERKDRPWLLPAIAGGVVGAIVAAAVAIPVARMAAPDAPASDSRLVSPITSQGGNRNGGRTSTIVDIAARARPWVVNINVGTSEPTVFGDVQVSGTGSGVILRSDGHILTNAHVVDGARSIEVTLASGDNLTANLVGSDPETDVAVVKVDRSDLPAAVIGSVKDLEVGQTAVAIGSPLGLEQSVTAGIISALGRRVERSDTETPLFDMIQTDAPVTQGNSGGALIDASGAVVGINSAIAASPQVGAEGIAFAIPIDVAIAVAEELINSGRATHPWLGITGGNITSEAADQFDVTKGAFIREVVGGGPADKAGIRPNDIIASFEGEDIETMDDLIVAIRQLRVGASVELVVIREGRRLTLQATLGDKPSS
jgi:S1-C subfamily serine protease